MADNVSVTAGSGTSVATDEISGVHYPRVKPAIGADGTAVDVVGGAGVNGTGVMRVTLATDDSVATALKQRRDSGWNYAAATGGIDNTTTAVTIIAAAGTGIRNYVTSLQIAHATLGATTELAIRDGAGGTVIWRTILHTTAMPLTNIVFDAPLIGTANTLLEVVTLTAVTGDVLVSAQGFSGA